MYHLNPICSEGSIRTKRNDSDNLDSFRAYFKEKIHYVEPPSFQDAPSGEDLSPEDLGLSPDATMADVLRALKRARELPTVQEEGNEEGADERPSQRSRTHQIACARLMSGRFCQRALIHHPKSDTVNTLEILAKNRVKAAISVSIFYPKQDFLFQNERHE